MEDQGSTPREKYEELAKFLNELGVEYDDDKDLVIPDNKPGRLLHYVAYEPGLGGWMVNGD